MDFNGIKEILEKVNSSNIAYFEYKTSDGHLVLDKSLTRQKASNNVISEDKVEEAIIQAPKQEVVSNVAEKKVDAGVDEDDDFTVIASPMVGTFYSAPSPDKEAYVKVGDNVSSGDVICIVEAMKLMNEIESEFNGVVKKILVKDGDMVEYGQPLFKIKED